MTDLDLEYYSRLLQQEKDSLLSFMAQEGMGKHVSLKDSIEELSLIDNHPADTGSELFERSKDLSLHEKRLRNLQDIESALERIANGSYGFCLRCAQQIDRERLESLPSASYCLKCKEELERADKEGKDRPVEEYSLYPPFKRTFLDGKSFVGYDGEDAWQEVARYGSADSPQDVPGAMGNPAYADAEENIGAVERIEQLESTENRRKTIGEEESNPEGGKEH